MKVPGNIEEMARVLYACPFIGASIGCDKHDGSIKIAEYLYNAGYCQQSEVIEEYRQKVNTKMGKHTHLLGKEYVQRILREVAKEMKGGAE